MMTLLMIFGALAITGISWLLTCGLVYVVFCCFGLPFSWSIGTGIWLILLILKSLISERKDNK